MIEAIFDKIVREEKYEWMDDFSKQQAHCPHQYCPSSIHIRSIKMNDKDYYYLSYIPHFHKPTLYQGNPHYLPLFIQHVLNYHSGIQYFIQQSTRLSHSSHSTIHLELLKEEQSIYTNDFQEILRQSALSSFGHDIDQDIINSINTITTTNNNNDEIKNDNEMNGK